MGQGTQALDTTTLVVVELDPTTRDRIAVVLDRFGPVAGCRTVNEMQRSLAGDAGVVVFGPSCADRRGIAAIDELTVSHPGYFSILIAESVTTDLMRDALRAGVRDVVSLDASFESQFSGALETIVQRLGASRPTPPPVAAPSRKGQRRLRQGWGGQERRGRQPGRRPAHPDRRRGGDHRRRPAVRRRAGDDAARPAVHDRRRRRRR
jgi:DNA-binding NarL/FixJ family response regulator